MEAHIISRKSSNFWIKSILKDHLEVFFPVKLRNKYQFNIRQISDSTLNDIFYQAVVDQTRKKKSQNIYLSLFSILFFPILKLFLV